MNIKITEIKTYAPLRVRRCGVCGKLFIKWYTKTCSEECGRKAKLKRQNDYYRNHTKVRLAGDKEANYLHRRATIEKRRAKRRQVIEGDLPNIKKAIKQGDKALVDYLIDHYAFNPTLKERRLYE